MPSNCRISEILFITHIIMLIMSSTITSKKEFINSINYSQKKAYERISSRRMLVYLFGGLFGALFAHLLIKQSCNQALSILLIQIIYYNMYKWPEYMKDHLTTQEQQILWNKVNKDMSIRYAAAIFIGGLSTLI